MKNKRMKKFATLALATALSTQLAACPAPLLVGAAATGAFIGLQERDAAQVAKDTNTKIFIKDKLTSTNFKYLSNITVNVFEGDVLLTGIVPDREAGEHVLALSRSTPNVQRVYNELLVGATYPKQQKARDIWVSTQIKPRLLGNRQTFPINYNVSVVNGHVYIIGYATSDVEHEHVLHVLRTTQGVVQVHDYLRILQNSEKAETTPIGNDT